MLECVVNVSEGRDAASIAAIAAAAGADLLDVHSDPHHHRSVLTLVGEEAPRRVATAAVDRLDLSRHDGVHPRLGVVDVVPFVALDGSTIADAVRARDDFAVWLADTHDVPCFLYGAERSLPDVRRHAFADLEPDYGPNRPHPSAGATCVGARPPLIAFNLWIEGLDLAGARAVAAAIRRPGLLALGLQVGHRVQVSMNLVAPLQLGPREAYHTVETALLATGGSITGSEVVGLVPRAVLDKIAPADSFRLGLSVDKTIEARLQRRR